MRNLITFLENLEREINTKNLEKIRILFHNWLDGVPFNSEFNDIKQFVFMHNKIKSKLNQALRILETNGWEGFYVILGGDGSGKTQFAIWLLNSINNLGGHTLIINLAKTNLGEINLEIARIIQRSKSEVIGVLLDNIESFLIEQDYLEKIHQLILNLLKIQRETMNAAKNIFFIITVNHSTWIRFSDLEINGEKLRSVFRVLSRINFSTNEFKSAKSDILRKIIAAYYLSAESKAVKKKIKSNAKTILSFLRKFYLSQLVGDINLRKMIINTSRALKIFVENLNEVGAQKKISDECKLTLKNFLINKLERINYEAVNDIFGINISTHIKEIEFAKKRSIALLEIKAVSHFQRKMISIPILLSIGILKDVNAITEMQENYGNALVFLSDVKDAPEPLLNLVKNPNIFCIALATWFRYLCYLTPEGAFILLNNFTKINEYLRLAILYFIFREFSKDISVNKKKEGLESIILFGVISALLKMYSSFYDYNDFEKLIVAMITGILSKIDLSLSEDYVLQLIDVIRSILETKDIIELIDNQYVFQTDKILSIRTIFELARTISRELIFRVKFLL